MSGLFNGPSLLVYIGMFSAIAYWVVIRLREERLVEEQEECESGGLNV